MRAPLERLLATLFALAICSAVPAQEAPASGAGRPRIGLVLSGGGARGAAHVGVLKVLEQMHVPIDAIAGTSMGAVVGGLYASGMSAAQIERELTSVDWASAFRDRPSRDALNFRRKREDQDFLVQFPLGYRDGRFQLPRGLIQGQKLSQVLRELTLPVSDVRDFDHLPTPFRAVATDLETGAGVVLSQGDLANALRASMSAPGVFVPVERDGRLLVDGGIANNVPIDVIRAMNVDLLIVVDVGFPLSSRDRLASVTSVANQMLAILIRRESEKQVATLGLGDVLISPDMPQISSFDFGSLPKATVAGEAATLAVRERLAMLALPPDQYERYLAQRNHPGHVPVVRNVRVQADSVAFARPVDALFGDLAGIRLDVPELNRRSNRYYGQGLIESLDYQLEPVQDGEPGSTADLLFSVHANPWGPNYVRFGLRIQDDFAGNSTFDAAAQVLFTDINSNGAEWQWEGQVGGNPRFGSALYLPFSQRRRWFVEPSVLLQIREVPEFQNEEQVGELRVRSLRLGTDLGREIGQSAEVRAGLAREFDRSRVRLGDSQGQQQNFTSNEYFLRYTLDDLDSVAFPRQGHALTLEWRGHLSEQFVGRVSDAVRIDWLEARSWGRNTVIAWASAGTLLDDKFADSRSYFPLGGFLKLSGLSADSLVGPHFGVARLIYFRKIGYGGEGFLNVPLYAGMSVEAGNTWQQRTDMTLHSARKDASLFFGMDTFLGPAWLAAGFDSSGRQAFYLSLGRGL